ncbi:MAG: type 4a pilus biogenesis protein PilO [Deltaproteobacteria bacterium]|nr:type 4a pilus biogenesis protein PilO [Deltaproteobacteria bacterium]
MEDFLVRYAKIPIRQRIGVFALITLLILVGHWYFIYSGQSQKYEALQQQYTQLETERAEKQAYVENLQRYEARLQELQQSLNTARSQLPDDPDVPQLLAQIGSKAKQAGLEIDRFAPTGEQPKDFYAEILFDVKIHGSFHEIGTFIDSMGKLDRILNVSNLSLINPRTINQKIILESTFMIKTYRFLDKVAPGEGK